MLCDRVSPPHERKQLYASPARFPCILIASRDIRHGLGTHKGSWAFTTRRRKSVERFIKPDVQKPRKKEKNMLVRSSEMNRKEKKTQRGVTKGDPGGVRGFEFILFSNPYQPLYFL